MILQILTVGPLATNCFLLGDEQTQEGVIIDPGSDAERILEAVAESELNIKSIIGTHAHFDHIGAIPQLKRSLNCNFLLHQEDLPFVRNSRQSALNWGFDIEQVSDPDIFFVDGEVIHVGSLDLQVIHTPGHSPGSVSLYMAENNMLFSGDTLFYRSIGRTDLPGGSMEHIIDSIRNRLYTLPDVTLAYTGHGESTNIGDEKKHNYFVQAE